jgi:hypothetical protein
MSEESTGELRRPRWRPPSVFWPTVLIGVGVALLLSNLGYLDWSAWNVLWRLWPLLLVALGIELLIGRRSVVGTIISGMLILALVASAIALAVFAQNIPVLADLAEAPTWHTAHVEHPLDGIKSASVTIDLTSLPCSVSALNDSPNLIEADVAYRGELIFDAATHGGKATVKLDSTYTGPWIWPHDWDHPEGRWDIGLSPQVPLDLNLDACSGDCDFDLSGLRLDGLAIYAGSGHIKLNLPAGSDFEAKIDGGSGSIDIALPAGVGARVVLDGGSGSFKPDSRFQLVRGERNGDGVWETGDFDLAEFTIELTIDQGSGSITIGK